MELLLIRHGKPHAINDPDGVDPGLTDEGRAQAQLIADALVAGMYGKVAAAVSSTMRRALETAAPSVEALGLDLRIDGRLVEMDQGSTHYTGEMNLYPVRADAWAALNEGRWGEHRFDPVTFSAQVLDGVEAAIETGLARGEAGQIAVFCHGGMISAYLAHVVGARQPFFFAPDYGSISRVLAGPGDHRELLSANETGHLR